jgi:hypothetical protein
MPLLEQREVRALLTYRRQTQARHPAVDHAARQHSENQEVLPLSTAEGEPMRRCLSENVVLLRQLQWA